MSVLGVWEAGPHDPGRQFADLPIAPELTLAAANLAADSGIVEVVTDPVVEGDWVRVGLGLDEEWVESASTVFPIVVDPSASLSGPYWDTYVRYNDTSNYSSSSDLLIGTANDGTNRYRTFITWNVSTMRGRDITWAGMYLYMYHAWSCNARSWTVYDVGGETVAQSRYWATQPSTSKYGPFQTTLTTTTGYESGGCANGWVGVNVTNNASRWSDFPTGSNLATVAVWAGSETDNYYWKRFYSSETSYDPYVSYTYNSVPTTPTAVSIDGTVLTTDVTLSAEQVADGVVVSTTAADPDGGEVQAFFTVKQGGVVIIDSLPGSKVTSGSVSSATLPYALASGVLYTIEVRVADVRSVSEFYSPTYTFQGPVVEPRDLPSDDDDVTGVAE
ncbi:MAG: DNRLRE domain-containing protein [Demequinaceae bacterium]|nr:DNRLRE domain-containing protein [Demequinaceae bacterium]